MSISAFAGTPDRSASLAHTVVTFEIKMAAPMAEVAPLFGAEKERAWAGSHWNPVFLYPQPPQDIKGAVFAISHGDVEAIWVCTALDLALGRIQYVYTIPNKLVTLIDVALEQTSDQTTVGHVRYERTALTVEGNDDVHQHAEADRTAAREWEDAINQYLKAQATH
jgi:hypothetical protein